MLRFPLVAMVKPPAVRFALDTKHIDMTVKCTDARTLSLSANLLKGKLCGPAMLLSGPRQAIPSRISWRGEAGRGWEKLGEVGAVSSES
ncbi:hypothetical protein E2C01_090144 [Portunus trituberculatus]|uniref:Uncharacterized protein n=1 Tax=Portunus trituberculatus TaxID=210409 RepID=A0A5B7JFF3_PORTR|nr:hypothetical protein [Portunus trituberculatus]